MRLVRALFVVAVVSVGCSRPDVREWTPSDHDQDPNTPGVSAPRPKSPADQGAALVDLAWDQNCLSCHGRDGRGDGPQGPMLRATDLTNPAFLASMTDEQLATSIKQGKGKMPKFGMPNELVAGLVKRIRLHKAP